jgi:hypothetical protein
VLRPISKIGVLALAILFAALPRGVDVDSIYEHAFDVHGVEVNDLRTASRSPINVGVGHFRYKLPDGRIWLDAQRP